MKILAPAITNKILFKKMSKQMKPSQQLSGHQLCEQHELVQGKRLLLE